MLNFRNEVLDSFVKEFLLLFMKLEFLVIILGIFGVFGVGGKKCEVWFL